MKPDSTATSPPSLSPNLIQNTSNGLREDSILRQHLVHKSEMSSGIPFWRENKQTKKPHNNNLTGRSESLTAAQIERDNFVSQDIPWCDWVKDVVLPLNCKQNAAVTSTLSSALHVSQGHFKLLLCICSLCFKSKHKEPCHQSERPNPFPNFYSPITTASLLTLHFYGNFPHGTW